MFTDFYELEKVNLLLLLALCGKLFIDIHIVRSATMNVGSKFDLDLSRLDVSFSSY